MNENYSNAALDLVSQNMSDFEFIKVENDEVQEDGSIEQKDLKGFNRIGQAGGRGRVSGIVEDEEGVQYFAVPKPGTPSESALLNLGYSGLEEDSILRQNFEQINRGTIRMELNKQKTNNPSGVGTIRIPDPVYNTGANIIESYNNGQTSYKLSIPVEGGPSVETDSLNEIEMYKTLENLGRK